MLHTSKISGIVCFCCAAAPGLAAIVPLSQARTVSAGTSMSAPDFAAWNRSVSGNVSSTNPSTPGLIVGSISAAQDSQAITPTFMGGQLSVGFSALRIGAGGEAQSRFEVVFDVTEDSTPVRMVYSSVNTGFGAFARTTGFNLAGPVTYSRMNVGADTTDLILSPGRYTITATAGLGPVTYDGSFGATVIFSMTAVPGPGSAIVMCVGAWAVSGRRRRR